MDLFASPKQDTCQSQSHSMGSTPQKVTILTLVKHKLMEGKEAREVEEGDGVGTETFELEAAEALAGLSCRSSKSIVASSSYTSQDPATAAQSNPAGKLKQSSNEAEREAKKLRRIEANRESARQSIRRKQAMYVELTRKATYLSEENENLKKAMEQATVKYNSLKERNNVLKAQMMKMKGEYEDTQGEPNSNNPPTLFYNQPSLVPCFWPSINPSSSNVYPLHCTPNPNNAGPSQLLVPDQGLENSTPVFLVPVQWMFPVLTHTNNIMPVQQFSTSGSSSDTMPRLHNENDFGTSGVSNSVSAMEHPTGNTSNNYRETLIGPEKQEDASGAAEARRKRRELMKMKKTR